MASSMQGFARQARAVGPAVRPVAENPSVALAEPLGSDGGAEERTALKQALAANLEDMIGGMLRTSQFATAATVRTRSWSRQLGEIAALDASNDVSAFTANSLVADLAQARLGPAVAVARSEAPRRWWIDAVLVLAGVLSVLSAGYFTFAN